MWYDDKISTVDAFVFYVAWQEVSSSWRRGVTEWIALADLIAENNANKIGQILRQQDRPGQLNRREQGSFHWGLSLLL